MRCCLSLFRWDNTVLEQEAFCCGCVIAVKRDTQVVEGGGNLNWNILPTISPQYS